MRPLPEKLSLTSENLDAIVLPIAHIHIPFGIERRGVRHVELTRTCAGFSPFQEVLAGGRELHQASIAVAVRDVDVAISREGDIGRFVEHPGRSAGLTLFS